MEGKEGKEKKEKGRKIVIVISGEPGAGSTTVAREVAKRLHLDFFSPGHVQKGFSKEKKESIAALLRVKTKEGSGKEFHNNLDKYQIEVAKKGNVVICGKLSAHFLKKYASLTAWLDVSPEVRAKRTAGRDNMSYDESLKSIAERAEIDRKSWAKIYGFNYHDQKKEADLVIDTSEMSIDETVKKILDEMRNRKIAE